MRARPHPPALSHAQREPHGDGSGIGVTLATPGALEIQTTSRISRASSRNSSALLPMPRRSEDGKLWIFSETRSAIVGAAPGASGPGSQPASSKPNIDTRRIDGRDGGMTPHSYAKNQDRIAHVMTV
jgi:hypothetical protein